MSGREARTIVAYFDFTVGVHCYNLNYNNFLSESYITPRVIADKTEKAKVYDVRPNITKESDKGWDIKHKV